MLKEIISKITKKQKIELGILTIKSTGWYSENVEIFLDGKPLTMVQSIVLDIRVGKPNKATITFIPSKIEVDSKVTIKRANNG